MFYLKYTHRETHTRTQTREVTNTIDHLLSAWLIAKINYHIQNCWPELLGWCPQFFCVSPLWSRTDILSFVQSVEVWESYSQKWACISQQNQTLLNFWTHGLSHLMALQYVIYSSSVDQSIRKFWIGQGNTNHSRNHCWWGKVYQCSVMSGKERERTDGFSVAGGT